MNKLCESYKKLSTSRKIGVSVTLNMVIMVLIISGALYIEFMNVKNSQEELPRSFFETYHQESLEEVSIRAKQLVLTATDYRSPFLASLTNLLVDYSNQTIQENNPNYLRPSNTTEFINKVMCVKSQKNSMFSCDMDPMARFFLEGGWPYHSKRSVQNTRRYNLVYQNLINKTDIMIFTISYIQDLRILNFARITEQMNGIQEGFLEFSSFYPDQYGTSSEELVSFHTKRTFADYQVLIETETFGGFIKSSITRIIYSDETNVLVITKNETQAEGFSLVTNLKPLEPGLEYKKLLTPGHHETVLPDGQIIYSFTITISSVYKLGDVSLAESSNLNSNYSLIIHTPSISIKAETRTYEIINNLSQKLFEFETTFSFCLYLLLGANVLRLANQIDKKLKTIKESMKKYSEDPSDYYERAKELEESQNEYWFGSVMRAIASSIEKIEFNKKKFRQKCEKTNKDEYPLNLLEPVFIEQEGWKELEKFDRMIEIMETSNPVIKGLGTIREDNDELKMSKDHDHLKKK